MTTNAAHRPFRVRRTNPGPQSPINVPELLDAPGADRLVHRIEAYWAQRGRRVACRVEPLSIPRVGREGIFYLWVVRSDLGLYMPPAR